ncbi:MAG: hypothetical protein PHY93_05045 [Bacteriovorax sp.]|nr:hypothetical protein [Bacteriovorax sp.]
MANMTSIFKIAEFFLISVAWTLTLFSPIASSRLTGNGFIKLLTNVSIGSLVMSLIIGFLSSDSLFNFPLYLKLISLSALVATTLFHKDDKSLFMWILYAVTVLALGYHIALFSPVLLNALFLLSSALLLGIILYSMLLGHWYLVVPKLSEQPLKIAAVVLWIILALKITLSLMSTYKHFDFFDQQTNLGAGYAFNWLLLTMRMSFGYIVILGMSLFNWKLVTMRSIQSSTGILYAMTFFVFIGELVSTYIFFNLGLYI